MEQIYIDTAKILKAISDPKRLKIVDMLSCHAQCANKLQEAFAITQPTLSHHMKILSDCELVQSRKDGKWIFYEINCCRFKEFKQYFESIQCWKDRLSASSRNGEDCCCCDGHKNVEN